MTRTIAAPLLAALTTPGRLAGECLVIAARDGTRLGFTSLARPQTIDLGLGAGAEICAAGMMLSEIVLATGFDASHFEASVPLGGAITRAAVLGGRWSAARAWLVRIAPGMAGIAPLMAGRVAEARLEGNQAVFEVRSAADAFNQSLGRTLSPYCSADFGDAQCGVVRTAYPCTVTAVAARHSLTISLGGVHPDNFFSRGSVQFLTGPLAGTAETEVFAYGGATGAVALYVPLVELPQVGNTLNLFRGCSKLIKSAAPALPTCLSYANAVNFRGFPEVPGTETYLKIAVPGAPGA